MQFKTRTRNATRIIDAPSAQIAAQIAEAESEEAAQVIALRDWPFPVSINTDKVPALVLVGEAEF